MTSCSEFAPELHMFIIWQNGLSSKSTVLQELEDRGFERIVVHDAEWSESHFNQNIESFYAIKGSSAENKVKAIGVGPFCVVTFWDNTPLYEFRETTRGFQFVNSRVFDLKADFREKILGANFVHGTNSADEARRDLFLIYSECYEQLTLRGVDGFQPRGDLPGVRGWENVKEILDVLNHCDEYVVMRNFEDLPDKVSLVEHGDIDFLTKSWRYTASLLSAVPVFEGDDRRHFHLVMKSGEKLPIDLRSVGDNYYDPEWQQRILENRVKFNGFYIPNDEDLRFSLIYHALLHKAKVSPDYTRLLTGKTDGEGTITWAQNRQELFAFLAENRYATLRPEDSSVFFDDRFFPSAISTQVREINRLGIKDVEPAFLEAWKNVFKSSYYVGRIADGRTVFIKCGGLKGSARREYKLLKKLNGMQPNFFPEPISYSNEDTNILVIEFVEGQRLDELVSDGLNDQEAAQKISTSLHKIQSCLHEAGIVHRDIRPANVIVDRDGNAVLIDFQMAISTKSPVFKEFKCIKRKFKSVKNLGEEFAAGRYHWDDVISMNKVCDYLCDAVGLTKGKLSLSEDLVGKLDWYGKRNSVLDRALIQMLTPVLNYSKARRLRRKQSKSR